MKPHPRIRKAVKWGGAAVTALLAVVWVGSGWYAVAWTNPANRVWAIACGCIFYQDWGPIAPFAVRPGWLAVRNDEPMGWCFYFYSGRTNTFVNVPLWALAAPVLLVTAAAWRLDTLARRRAGRNLCPKCHYDRAGLAAGAVCPECGAAAEPAPLA